MHIIYVESLCYNISAIRYLLYINTSIYMVCVLLSQVLFCTAWAKSTVTFAQNSMPYKSTAITPGKHASRATQQIIWQTTMHRCTQASTLVFVYSYPPDIQSIKCRLKNSALLALVLCACPLFLVVFCFYEFILSI